jgi:hypothetical protein
MHISKTPIQRTERINFPISVEGGTLIQTMVVEAFLYARFDVASSSPRQMVFMSNPPPHLHGNIIPDAFSLLN